MTLASHYDDRPAFLRDARPGSYWISPKAEGDTDQTLIFFCPCGCGDKSLLNIGNGFKPEDSPSWHWNGLTDAITLEPSVNWQGHWHGWLRAGVWSSC